jgi:hypothetical protein
MPEGDIAGLARALEREAYGDAARLAWAEAERSDQPFEKVVLEATAHYAELMAEWMIAYDSTEIRKSLLLAQRRLRRYARRRLRARQLSERDRAFLAACKAVNIATHAHLSIENTEVSSDARRMFRHACRARAVLQHAPVLHGVGRLQPLADRLNDEVAEELILFGAMARYADVLLRRDRLSAAEFVEEAWAAYEAVAAAIRMLPGATLSTATHLRMHLRFLELHSRIAVEDRGHLRLLDASVVSFVSWTVSEKLLTAFADVLLEDPAAAHRFLGDWAGPVAEPPVMDLYRTPRGTKLTAVRSVDCGTLRIRLLGVKLDDVRVSLKLHGFGVAALHFEFTFAEASVRTVRECQSLVAPHAARRRIMWAGDPYPSLADVAKRVADDMKVGLQAFLRERQGRGDLPLSLVDRDWTFLPHLAWFTYVRSPRWILRQGGEDPGDREVRSIQEMEDHPELVGLVLGPREARATIDDWMAGPRPALANLAPTRSHVTDLMVMTENHGVLFYPDDPYYLVEQFADSVELVAKLRCLAVSLNHQALTAVEDVYQEATRLRDRLGRLQRGGLAEASDLDAVIHDVEEHRVRTVEFRNGALLSLELIGESTVSRYRDHAEQVREAIGAARIPAVVAALEKKLEMLRADLDTIATAAELAIAAWRARREKARELEAKRRDRGVSVILVIITVAQAHTFAEEALRYFCGEWVAKPLAFELVALLGVGIGYLYFWSKRPDTEAS